MAILVGDEGSFFPNLTQSHAKKGASVTTKTELSDWKKLAGTTKNPRSRLVCSSAKKVSEAPACSKALQKKTTKKETVKITSTLLFSTLESVLSVKTIKAMVMIEAERMKTKLVSRAVHFYGSIVKERVAIFPGNTR